MAAEESARFVRRTGVAVTPEVLEQLDADVKWLAVDYRRRPKYAMFRPLAGLRRDVFDMIDRHPRPAHLIDLYRVAGQLSSLLALASFDLGQPYAADNHARAAWLCADLADNNTLRPYIRWCNPVSRIGAVSTATLLSWLRAGSASPAGQRPAAVGEPRSASAGRCRRGTRG